MITFDSSTLSFWESVGEAGFLLVILGVVGEGAEIIVKLFLKEVFKKREFFWELTGAISWSILVIGLGVEFMGNHRAMQIADAQNSKLNREAAMARRDASQAIKSAADANERASAAELAKIELSQQLERLRATNLILQAKLMEHEDTITSTRKAVVTMQPGLRLLDQGSRPEGTKTITRFVFGSALANESFGQYSLRLEFAEPYENVAVSLSRNESTVASVGASPQQTSDPEARLVYSLRGVGLEGYRIILDFFADRPLRPTAVITDPSPAIK